MKNKGHIEFPDWIGRFVNRLCGDDWEEGVQGDLQENFKERTSRLGQRKAKLWLYLELTGLLRFVFYQKKRSYNNSNFMFWNYLKITLRSFKRNKAYTLINIFGLASGLVVFILITIYVNHEFSYDNYHKNKDSIHKIYIKYARIHEGFDKSAMNNRALATALMAEFPEIVYATRFYDQLTPLLIRANDQNYLEPSAYATDPETFKMFSFETLAGDISNFLVEKNTVVLSESMAMKYFGKANVLGEVIYCAVNTDEFHPMKVVGVIKDMPANTHLKMGVIFQLETLLDLMKYPAAEWGSQEFHTYLMIHQDSDPELLEHKLPQIRAKYADDPIDEDGQRITYEMQPLSQVHLDSDADYEIAPTANLERLGLYLGIALAILIIAGINYVNLATAQAIKRTKEIGIRKVVGAQSKNLIFQFLIESFLLVSVAMVIALLCIVLLLPAFSQFVDRELVLDFTDPILWLFLGGLCIGLTFLSGIYPSFVLTSFQPVAALKGKAQQTKGALLKSILVVFQFTISAVLILAIVVLSRQLNYIHNMDVGYIRDQVVVFGIRDQKIRDQLPVFKSELKKIPGIKTIASSSALPNYIGVNGYASGLGDKEGAKVHMNRGNGDYDFVDLYGLKIVQGRNFSPDIESDKKAILLNETAVEAFGWENPIGRQIIYRNDTGSVIGVLKDFHLHSHREIRPLCLFFRDKNNYRVSVKIGGNQLKETIVAIEEKYESFSPEYPFDYQFFDDVFDQRYLTEIKTAKLANWFAGLTILVASLGLYGLATYKVEQRIKEVGIRKVLGASVPKILTLLSKDFVRLLVIAFLIAAPIAYYVMDDWLNNFAYHVSIGVLTFIITIVGMILIAGLAVGHCTYRAAVRNPVESLRDE